MRVLILSTTFYEKILILRRIPLYTIINVHTSSYKVPILLVRFQSNLHFLDRFSKNPQISIFMKIRSMGAEMFHADRRTDGQT
jgi:hypothetical protein